MLTHYQGSKGVVEIASMPLSYAKNAANKLRRTEPERAAEIEAIDAHVARLEAEAMAAPREAVMGDNGGPPIEEPAPVASAPATFEAIKINMDDLLTEAANWGDGAAIITQDQADAVARLRQDLQEAASAAEAARVAEKQPLDEQIAEIQARYNAYIAPLKNKQPGSVSKAVAVLGNMLSAWLNKLDAEKREREREAAAAAAAAAQEALAARAEAKTTGDLDVMDRAEDKLAEAEALLKAAKGVQKEKVQAQGSTRAVGLRSVWIATITDRKAALLHYLNEQPEMFAALIQELADKDARNAATRRAIPGVKFTEEKKV